MFWRCCDIKIFRRLISRLIFFRVRRFVTFFLIFWLCGGSILEFLFLFVFFVCDEFFLLDLVGFVIDSFFRGVDIFLFCLVRRRRRRVVWWIVVCLFYMRFFCCIGVCVSLIDCVCLWFFCLCFWCFCVGFWWGIYWWCGMCCILFWWFWWLMMCVWWWGWVWVWVWMCVCGVIVILCGVLMCVWCKCCSVWMCVD